MQIQVHTNDNIQGGESLIRWAQDEAAAKLAVRTRAMVWRSFMIFPSRKRTVSKKMGWQAWG